MCEYLHLQRQVAEVRHTKGYNVNGVTLHRLQEMGCQIRLAETARVAPKLLLLIP